VYKKGATTWGNTIKLYVGGDALVEGTVWAGGLITGGVILNRYPDTALCERVTVIGGYLGTSVTGSKTVDGIRSVSTSNVTSDSRQSINTYSWVPVTSSTGYWKNVFSSDNKGVTVSGIEVGRVASYIEEVDNVAVGTNVLKEPTGAGYHGMVYRNIIFGKDVANYGDTVFYNTLMGENIAEGVDPTISYLSNNIFVGQNIRSVASGTYEVEKNVGIGNSTQEYVRGSNNVSVGDSALKGTYNSGEGLISSYTVAIGKDSMKDAEGNITQCVAVGSSALLKNKGNYNTAVGVDAGKALGVGNSNVFIGWGAGDELTSGTNNIFIGANSGSTTISAGNTVYLGDSNISTANIKVNWTTTSDLRDKADVEDLAVGMDFIKAIKPIRFVWDDRSLYEYVDENGGTSYKPKDGSLKKDKVFFGFGSQQIMEVEDSFGIPQGVIVDRSDPEMYRLKETAFIPILVNALKELEAKVTTLENRLAQYEQG